MPTKRIERALLGAIVQRPESVLYKARDAGINDNWFTEPSLRSCFNAIVELDRDGKVIDPIVVYERMRKNGVNEDNEFINHLIDDCPSPTNAGHYIAELKTAVVRKEVAKLGRHLAETMAHSENPVDDASKYINDILVHVSPTISSIDKSSVKKLIAESWQNAMKNGFSGVGSPWPKLNSMLGGLRPGVVTLFTGRAGKGKSSALCSWAYHLGKDGTPVGFLSFEDGVLRTWARLAGIHGDFSVFLMDKGQTTDNQYDHSMKALDEVMTYPVHIEEKTMSIDAICSWAIMANTRYGIQALFIDAFKDISRDSYSIDEDSLISRRTCELARRLNIPILVNHHVRKGQAGDDGRLGMDDIRGSGQIASDARQIIILQNFVEDGVEAFDWEIAKNNYGPTGSIQMDRISNRCMWKEKVVIADEKDGVLAGA